MIADSLEVKISADDSALVHSLAKLDKQLAGIDKSGDKVLKNFKNRFDNILPNLLSGKFQGVSKELNKLTESLVSTFSKTIADSFLNRGVPGSGYTGRAIGAGGIIGGIFQSSGSEKQIFNVIEKVFSSVIAGARAQGGPVAGGRPYIVGENGAELFTPGQSGFVSPLSSRGININMVVNTPNANSFRDSNSQIVAEMARAIRMSSRNT